MKTRIILSALFIILLSTAIGFKADAGPWRHGHYGVRVMAPCLAIGIPHVVVGGYYGGYYAPPRYYAPYYGPRVVYGGPGYYGRGYYGGHGYYGHGYSHSYGYRGRR